MNNSHFCVHGWLVECCAACKHIVQQPAPLTVAVSSLLRAIELDNGGELAKKLIKEAADHAAAIAGIV